MSEEHAPEETAAPGSKKVAALLVIIPLWLCLSGGIALWFYVHKESQGPPESPRAAAPVTEDSMQALMHNIAGFVGERNSGSLEAGKGLTSMMAMADSTLGPGNTGYDTVRYPLPPADTGSWPLVVAKIRGHEGDEGAIWVVAPCDSLPGSAGAVDNGSGAAVVMSAARSLAATGVRRSIFFVFTPYGADPAGQIDQTAKVMKDRLPAGPSAVLVVERATGGLKAASRSGSNPVLQHHGPVQAQPPGERLPSALGSALAALGLPVAALSSQEAGKGIEEEAPATAGLILATGQLTDLLLDLDGYH